MRQLLIIGLILLAVMFSGCIDTGEIERTITIVDKTAEVVRDGFGSSTAYKVLADDGDVYHTSWTLYRSLELNETYVVQVRGYSTPSEGAFWWIFAVEESK
jgi:hypothetical protein